MRTTILRHGLGPESRALRCERQRRGCWSGAAAFGFFVYAALGQAQPLAADGANEPTPMAQGEAAIQVRSDVKLAIKGAGGTPKERLDSLATVVSGELEGLRRCYRERVAGDPQVVGAFRVAVALEEDRRPVGLEVEARSGSDGVLQKCVEQRLSGADYGAVARPARAILTLRFENSRADGQQVMVKSLEAADYGLQRNAAAGVRGGWADPSRRVTFAVEGDDEAAVVGLLGTLRDRFAAFLDCRRRAEKGGQSPAGVMEFEVAAKGRGVLSVELSSSSVSSERAPKCANQALRRSHCEPCGSAPLHLAVTFGE